MNLVTGEYLVFLFLCRTVVYLCLGLWGMNVHVPGQDVTEVSF
jgi:Mg2+ and Co2+ transporter CorA